MSNLGSMLGIYSALTVAYIGIKFKTLTNKNKQGKLAPTFKMWYTLTYALLVIGSSVLLNINTASKTCGNNFTSIVMVTILSWTTIFGVIIAMLQTSPGWKAPFANTLGYLVAKVMGAKKSIAALNPGGKADNAAELKKLCEEKNSSVVNVHTWDIENPDNPVQDVLNLFRDSGKNAESVAAWAKFSSLVLIKDLVGELVWYLLVGFLVISYQSSYISVSACPDKVDKLPIEIEVPDQENKKN